MLGLLGYVWKLAPFRGCSYLYSVGRVAPGGVVSEQGGAEQEAGFKVSESVNHMTSHDITWSHDMWCMS